ncbi:unnamed protein product [marine sediment metagenome]|uniref:Uncharacterized protein n=1 Tax=marine sediment metagenome TaxID=412755 RepID=X0XBI5_9ZZZZ
MPLYEVKGRAVIDAPPHPDAGDLTITGIVSTHIKVHVLYELGRIVWARPPLPPPPWVFASKWRTIEPGKKVILFLGPIPGVPPFSHTLYFRKLKYLRDSEGEDVTALISIEEMNVT